MKEERGPTRCRGRKRGGALQEGDGVAHRDRAAEEDPVVVDHLWTAAGEVDATNKAEAGNRNSIRVATGVLVTVGVSASDMSGAAVENGGMCSLRGMAVITNETEDRWGPNNEGWGERCMPAFAAPVCGKCR